MYNLSTFYPILVNTLVPRVNAGLNSCGVFQNPVLTVLEATSEREHVNNSGTHIGVHRGGHDVTNNRKNAALRH